MGVLEGVEVSVIQHGHKLILEVGIHHPELICPLERLIMVAED